MGSEAREKWADIPGYDGLYVVSNLGRVARLVDGVPRVLKGRLGKRGYPLVNLSRHSIMTTFRVHRLVAEAFVENPNGYTEVNHRNEDKTDNRASNLEWCSRSYNVNYGSRTAKQKEKVSIPCVSYMNGVTEYFKSLSDASKATGATVSQISAVCKGKRKTAKGRKWRYQYEQPTVG